MTIDVITNTYAEKIETLCREAKKRIWIATYALMRASRMPAKLASLCETLIEKADKQGVDVRIITCQKNIRQDFNYANMLHYKRLTDGNIKLKLYNKKGLMHEKVIIVDTEHLIIGSHNLTARSIDINEELSIYLRDENIVRRVSEHYESLWREAAWLR